MKKLILKSASHMLNRSQWARHQTLRFTNWLYSVRSSRLLSSQMDCTDRRFQILLYHRVLPEVRPLTIDTVQSSDFEKQVRLLATHFRLITVPQLLQELEDGSLKPNTVCLTFDDGYRDNYVYAYPVLKKYGASATIFLATGVIGNGKMLWHDRVLYAIKHTQMKTLTWSTGQDSRCSLQSIAERKYFAFAFLEKMKRKKPLDRNREITQLFDACEVRADECHGNEMLSWEEVREMHGYGIAFGAHTVTHPILALLDDDETAYEISESKRILEANLNTKIDTFAYPNGGVDDFDGRVKRMLRDHGIRCGLTTIWGINSHESDPYAWHRARPWKNDINDYWNQMISLRLFEEQKVNSLPDGIV